MLYQTKKIFVLSLLVLCFTQLRAQNSSQQKEVLKFLSTFYTKYISEVASSTSPKVMERNIAVLQKQSCTSRLLARIPEIISKTDADPFLKAQDADITVLKTLSVVKVSRVMDEYVVSYFSAPDNYKFVINLKVIKKGNDWKIDRVW